MGDQGGGGLGTDLQGIASQWAGSAPANDRYPLFQSDPPKRWARPVTNPPANDPGMTPQGQLNQMSDDDLMAQHRQTVTDHQQSHANYNRLMQLKNGDPPKNYTEATLVQAHPDRLNGLIERYTRSLTNSGRMIDEQRHNLYKRSMVSPFEGALKRSEHMPVFPDPVPGSMPRPRFAPTTLPGNVNQPGGNPMSPIARPPLIGSEHLETERPSGLPRELTFGRPANENQPPVE